MSGQSSSITPGHPPHSSSSGQDINDQPFQNQLKDVSDIAAGVASMNSRRQGGSSNQQDRSNTSDDGRGGGAPLSASLQALGGQSNSHDTSSYVSRDSRHHRPHRNSSAVVSFTQHPPAQNNSGRNFGQQTPAHKNSHFRGQAPGSGPNGPPQAPSQPYNIDQIYSKFKSNMTEIQQSISRFQMPSPHREYLRSNLHKIEQEFDTCQRKLQHEWDSRANKYNQVSNELEQARNENLRLVAERNQAVEARNDLELQVARLRLRHKSSAEKLTELEQEWKAKNESLKEQLRIQDEQLNGKRALWLSSHPTSSARRDAMTALRNPFQSPTRPGQENSTMERKTEELKGPSTYALLPPPAPFSQQQPPLGPRFRGLLPTGKAKPISELEAQPLKSIGSMRYPTHITTEPGDTPLNPMYSRPVTPVPVEPPMSSAVVLRGEYVDPSPPYQAALEELFDGCEAWAKKFTRIPNPAGDRLIASTNQDLWKYMTNCTYPQDPQNAHTHTTALLNDPENRYWFVMRMISQYFVDEVLNIRTFRQFSTHHDALLDHAKQIMLERVGSANENRQVWIDEQARCVQSIADSPEFKTFRASRLSTFTRTLRDMLGPILDIGVQRAAAGQEIGKLAIKAFELAVQMFSSFVTFQVFFPETCTKFIAAQMTSRDHPNEDSNHIQTRQIRVKFVMTPVVTLRDDRTTTIRVKNLLHANVLLMS